MRSIKIFIRITSCCLALLLPLLATAQIKAQSAEAPQTINNNRYEYEYVESNPTTAPEFNGMKPVAENDELILYLNEETTEIAVKSKKTEAVFYSNPPEREQDAIASKSNREKMASQLLVNYYNSSYKLFSINNYTQSILLDNYEIRNIRNGIKITYTLTENRATYIYPKVISASRMEQFCANLTESEASELRKRRYLKISLTDAKSQEEYEEMQRLYPSISETNDIYTIRATQNENIQKKIHELFEKAGYTEEELTKDNLENKIQGEEKSSYRFVIPVVYCLDGQDFLAYIPGEEIEYDEKWPISSVALLPFFGAADNDDEGYIFVPDGSGALIHLNNGRVNTQGYYGQVYGDDKTLQADKKAIASDELSLPVFGMNISGTGMLAIIEDGEAFASISADISGKANSYNTVYAIFEVLPSSSLDLGDVLGTADKVLAFGDGIYDGCFAVRYSILDEDVSYAGMANRYREYLMERNALNQSAIGTLPFVTDIIGSINKKKSFMGITYEGEIALTTFDQCAQIVDALLEKGVTPTVRFSGWMNGGMQQGAATKVKILSVLGGVKDFNTLANKLKEESVPFYPNVSLQYSYGDSWFDGFSSREDSAKTQSGSLAVKYDYDVITGKIDREKKAPFIISSARFPSLFNQFTKAYARYNVSGLSLATIGTELSSDHHKSKSQNRQESLLATADLLSALNETYSLMSEGANAYTLPYVDCVLNLPSSSNKRYICDASVPFLQMVLHGSVAYTGEAFNFASDGETAKLKAIETGSGLYVQWIYADNSLVKDTEFSWLYAAQYLATLEWATSTYNEVANALEGLEQQQIVGHSYLTDQVTKTVYSNGTSVYVNYGNADFVDEEITVSAKGYFVKRGV